MTQAEALTEQIEKSVVGPAWYGPSLMEAIADISADQAEFRLDNSSHNIWQLIWHLNNWIGVFHNRLNGKEMPWLPDEEEWPTPRNLTEQEWKTTKDTVLATHRRFIESARQISDSQLNARVPGKDYSFRFMFE